MTNAPCAALTRGAVLVALACACRADPAATSGPAAPPSPERSDEPPDWKAAFRHEIRYDAARSAIVVDVRIADGFHVYTEGETIGKPMKLTLTEASDFEIEGRVVYPEGETKDLPIGRSVIVEGEAEIVAPIRPKAAEATSSQDEGIAEGRFRYQVCTDEACDRPRTESFELTVAPTAQG